MNQELKVNLILNNRLDKLKEFWSNRNLSKEYCDYFYEKLFNDERLTTYVLENDEIIASALVFCHMYHFFNHNIGLGLISDIYTVSDDEKTILIKEILKDQSFQNLITVVESNDLDFWGKLGFEVLASRKTYFLKKEDFKYRNFGKVKQSYKLDDLEKIYAYFYRRFAGFNYRFHNDFVLLINNLQAKGKKLITYYEKDIKGYMIYQVFDDYILIEEAIYRDLKSLVSMLGNLFAIKDELRLQVSSFERLDHFFKPDKTEEAVKILARINDLELFNELYNSDVKNLKEALQFSDKPFYIHEEF